MMRHQRIPRIPPRDYTADIETLHQQVVAFTQHRHGHAPSPPSLAEATEELFAALEELQAVNAELTQTQQLAIRDQLRYRELFELAPDGYLVTDLNGTIQEANRAAAALLNIMPDRLPGIPLIVFIASEACQPFRAQLAWLQNGAEVHEWGIPIQPRHKPVFPAVFSVTPARDARGQVIGLRWLLRDITERQRAHEALEQRVRERTMELTQANTTLQAALGQAELLMKELHHRVKNNLQVIASLLHLQSASLQEPRLQAIFQDCQERIRAMALVHELLYQSGDLERVELARYLKALAIQMFRSYRISPERIRLTIQADEVYLHINTAIPCGLLCHELLSNCFKHAFPEDRSGEVTIILRAVPAGQLTLTVHDTGVGFPTDVNFRRTESLGLQLVSMLTEQLRGTIALERHGGTRFTLTFPI
jgi:PAS domain S-box-containing protein